MDIAVSEVEIVKALWDHLKSQGVHFGAGTYQEYERAKRIAEQWVSKQPEGQAFYAAGRALRMIAYWVGV